jgi:hypothetical protein
MLAATSPLAAALDYAARGWPVVPLHTPRANGSCSCRHGATCTHSGKHPRYHPHDLPYGLHNATTDADLVHWWWRRWPQANIGVATGTRSGLLVVDVDGPVAPPFPPTATVQSGKGQHFYFEHPHEPLRSRIRLLPELDIRGEHALIVAPPSRHANGAHYRWQGWDELLPLPLWLLAHLRPLPSPTRPSSRPRCSTAYAQAVLRGEVARLAAAPIGKRNTTLNWAAFRCGQFVGSGQLDRAEVEHQLSNTALALGLGPREVAATLRSGLTAGMRQPARR